MYVFDFLVIKNVIKTISYFFKKKFEWLDKPNLLINIWSYNDPSHYGNHCSICKQYENWCIEIAREKCRPEFKSFDFVISQIQTRNKRFLNFERISSAERNCIYRVIHKNY